MLNTAPARRRSQQGITLVELMIAGTLALIAMAAVLGVYAATARHSRLQLQSAHLHQQARGILQLIGQDLRRAGYWQFDPARRNASDNPFQQAGNRLRSGAWPGEAPDSCILLAYDLDRDGAVGVGRCQGRACPPDSDADNVEQFGYRLRKGSVQARYGGDTLSCATGYWQTLNDPDIEVTRLRFVLYPHCVALSVEPAACNEAVPRLVRHAVSVTLEARLRRRPATAISLQRWVVVRNARLLAASP